jgi:hypothetical protein
MKSGTTLNVSFQLTTAVYKPLMSSSERWGVAVNHARIENVVTGVSAAEWPDTSPSGLKVGTGADDYLNTVWVSVQPNAAFDPTVPSCPKDVQPDNFPLYEINVQLTNATTLAGTARLLCFAPGNLNLDSQPIVLRRI